MQNTTQKLKFSIKDFFSKCDQIRSKLRIWSNLLKKPLMENFIFCEVWSVFSFYSHNSPVSRYQIVLNLKPVCSTGLRFQLVLRLLLGQMHFFENLYRICLEPCTEKSTVLLWILWMVFDKHLAKSLKLLSFLKIYVIRWYFISCKFFQL